MVGVFAVAGVVGLAVWAMGCAKADELPELPSLNGDNNDSGTETGVGGAAGSAGDSGKDAVSEKPQADAEGGLAETGTDAPVDTYQPESGNDAYADADAKPDYTEASVGSNVACTFVAKDSWGVEYAMTMKSISPISVSAAGFTGQMRFQATVGTNPAIEIARQQNPAYTWPDPQVYPNWTEVIPSWAQYLTGHYDVTVSQTGAKHYLAVQTRDLSAEAGNSFMGAAIFPMTFLDDVTKKPQPVAADTSNEGYVAAQSQLNMEVSCAGNCGSLTETAPFNMNTLTNNQWASLKVSCKPTP